MFAQQANSALCRSAPAKGLVQHDAAQPCAERRLSSKTVDRGEPLEVPFLDGFLGIRPVFQHAPRSPIETLVVTPGHDAHSKRVAPGYELRELDIGQSFIVQRDACHAS